jgi:hypothetical protein
MGSGEIPLASSGFLVPNRSKNLFFPLPQRIEIAKGILNWAGNNARPMAEKCSQGAMATGEMVGQGAKIGGGVMGVGVAGVGLLAVGGTAGIAVVTVGAGIGAAGLAGAWLSNKIGQGMGWGFNMAGM